MQPLKETRQFQYSTMTSGTEHFYTHTEYHLWEEKQEQEDGKGKKFRGKTSEQGEEKRKMKGGKGRVYRGHCFADKLILVEVLSVLFCVTRDFSLICICLNSYIPLVSYDRCHSDFPPRQKQC